VGSTQNHFLSIIRILSSSPRPASKDLREVDTGNDGAHSEGSVLKSRPVRFSCRKVWENKGGRVRPEGIEGSKNESWSREIEMGHNIGNGVLGAYTYSEAPLRRGSHPRISRKPRRNRDLCDLKSRRSLSRGRLIGEDTGGRRVRKGSQRGKAPFR